MDEFEIARLGFKSRFKKNGKNTSRRIYCHRVVNSKYLLQRVALDKARENLVGFGLKTSLPEPRDFGLLGHLHPRLLFCLHRVGD